MDSSFQLPLKDISRKLRKSQTPWETKLWQYLRGNRLEGLKFKRQVPMGPYVVDFCCQDKKLVVESDGSQHADDAQKATDTDKQEFLERQGYMVLHFWNNDIMNNINGVLEVIVRAVNR
jgi:very-short-patch-repair endonuclease